MSSLFTTLRSGSGFDSHFEHVERHFAFSERDRERLCKLLTTQPNLKDKLQYIVAINFQSLFKTFDDLLVFLGPSATTHSTLKRF